MGWIEGDKHGNEYVWMLSRWIDWKGRKGRIAYRSEGIDCAYQEVKRLYSIVKLVAEHSRSRELCWQRSRTKSNRTILNIPLPLPPHILNCTICSIERPGWNDSSAATIRRVAQNLNQTKRGEEILGDPRGPQRIEGTSIVGKIALETHLHIPSAPRLRTLSFSLATTTFLHVCSPMISLHSVPASPSSSPAQDQPKRPRIEENKANTHNLIPIPLPIPTQMYPIPSTQTTPFWTRWQTIGNSIIGQSEPRTGMVYRYYRHVVWLDRGVVGGVGYGESCSAECGGV